MPIKEINPEDPIFQTLKQEVTTIKIHGSKFEMPKFLQKRDATTITQKLKPVPIPVTVSVVPVIQTEPEPIPVTEQVAGIIEVPKLEQVKLKVKSAWELPTPTSIKKRPVPPSPIPEPVPAPQPIPAKEPSYIHDPAGAAERIMQRHTTPTPAKKAIPEYVWPRPTPTPEPVTAPMFTNEYPDMADIYGTGKKPGGGFRLPFIFQRKEKQFIPPEDRVQVSDIKMNIDWKKMGGLIAQVGVGIVAVWFGLTSTGSFYEPASRFSGELATIFYGYQLGTLFVVLGCLLGYDAIRRAGKL